MPRICSICLHSARTEIDRAIVKGEPMRAIAARHGCQESSLRRHRDTHLRRALARAIEQERTDIDADRLITWTQTLHAKTLIVLERAEALDDLSNARGLIREARENLVLLGRLAGVLEGPRVSIDMRRHYAVLGKLDENTLRALASGDVVEAEAVEIEEAVT